MPPRPAILTNMAFAQSPVWRQRVVSICQPDESPDSVSPWRQAFRLLRLRHRFDVVVTMGPRPSLAYGLLCGLLRLPSRQILAEFFLDQPRPHSFIWRAKTALFRRIAKRALGVLTNSSAEVKLVARRFRMPEDRLRFVPMYTTIGNPRPEAAKDGTVVSIGRTWRDLDTLVAAAQHIPAPVVIVTGRRDVVPAPLPPNVQVLRELPLAQAYELLSRAAVVAIPLIPVERSTGQVVLFEAVALGKAVVATRVAGTTDYIRNGENGLLVEPGDVRSLAEAVNRLLHDPALAQRLGLKALADCRADWMPDHHADRMLKAINDLWTGADRSAPLATLC